MGQSGAKRQIFAKFEWWCVQERKDNPGKDRATGNDACFLVFIPKLEAKDAPQLIFRAHVDKSRFVHMLSSYCEINGPHIWIWPVRRITLASLSRWSSRGACRCLLHHSLTALRIRAGRFLAVIHRKVQ